MDVRVLVYFLAVAREESISGAAAVLHLTQPTLSRQLKELEDELGKQLFTRGRRISLTEDGLLLRKRAEEIIELMHKTEKELMQDNRELSGDIYIGAGETRGMELILRLAHQMQREHPQIRFHISSGDRQDIADRLEKGLDDFALFMGTVDERKYEFITLPVKDRWGVLMRQDDPLTMKGSVAPEDLRKRTLVISRQTSANSELMRWFGVPLEELNITATYNLVYNASLMATEGLGVVLTLDGLIDTGSTTSLAFRPLEPPVSLDMAIAWKRYPAFSTAATKFLELLRTI